MSHARTTSRTGSKGAPGWSGATRTTRAQNSTAKAAGPEPVGKDLRSLGALELAEEGFVVLNQVPVLLQVEWVRNGVSTRDTKTILGQLRVPQGEVLCALQIPVATVNRKAKTNAPLSPAKGECVLGVGRLLGQLQAMVQESGDGRGFDASACCPCG